MIDIRIGDMRVSLDEMEPNSIDSCVTDPPYHLASIVKRFGAEGAAPAKSKQSAVTQAKPKQVWLVDLGEFESYAKTQGGRA